MAAVGWLEMGSKRDAIEYAKGYATRHMNSAPSSWFAVAPLLGGWLWEVQEGAVGKSHIPEIIKALSAGVETSWFRVGRRAYTVSMRDGRPFPVLLPEKESREFLASGENRLNATGKMERVVKSGMGIFAFGLAVFMGGGIFLAAAAGYYALSQRHVPLDRQVDGATLPHHQWNKVQNVPPNLFVETLRLTEGSTEWQAVIKPIQQTPAQAPVEAGQAPEDSPPLMPEEVLAPPVPTDVIGSDGLPIVPFPADVPPPTEVVETMPVMDDPLPPVEIPAVEGVTDVPAAPVPPTQVEE